MALVVCLCALGGFGASASARMEYQYQFYFVYNTRVRSNIWKASCRLCHTSRRGGPLNKYGRDLRKTGKYEKYQYEGYRAIEGLDSDGDHWTNGQEISKDRLPGDPASHPKKAKRKKSKAEREKQRREKARKKGQAKKGKKGKKQSAAGDESAPDKSKEKTEEHEAKPEGETDEKDGDSPGG